MQIVVNHGGVNGDNVTKKTNYLVLGNNDYCTLIKDGKSNKHKKAEQLKLEQLRSEAGEEPKEDALEKQPQPEVQGGSK